MTKERPPEISEDLWDSLQLYLEEGLNPGSFLTAVLTNDLQMTVAHADPECMASLKRLVQYVYCDCPSACWGSKEKVQAWEGTKR